MFSYRFPRRSIENRIDNFRIDILEWTYYKSSMANLCVYFGSKVAGLRPQTYKHKHIDMAETIAEWCFSEHGYPPIWETQKSYAHSLKYPLLY